MIGNSSVKSSSLSATESNAGLKKGAVDGFATATPAQPMAMDLGSKELNGTARLAVVTSKTADPTATEIRFFLVIFYEFILVIIKIHYDYSAKFKIFMGNSSKFSVSIL